MGWCEWMCSRRCYSHARAGERARLAQHDDATLVVDISLHEILDRRTPSVSHSCELANERWCQGWGGWENGFAAPGTKATKS